MDRAKRLRKIDHEIEKCPICPIGKSGKPVPGEGNPNAKVVFIGEAPGKQEAVTGRPFVGRSGKFLRSQIRESGLSEDEVYITSPVKYLPNRGTPTPGDIAHGKTHLDRQLEVIDPEIIVLLGRVACEGVLGEFVSVTTEHGTIRKKGGKKYFITYHPSAAIRFTKIQELFKQDFQKLRKVIGS